MLLLLSDDSCVEAMLYTWLHDSRVGLFDHKYSLSQEDSQWPKPQPAKLAFRHLQNWKKVRAS